MLLFSMKTTNLYSLTRRLKNSAIKFYATLHFRTFVHYEHGGTGYDTSRQTLSHRDTDLF